VTSGSQHLPLKKISPRSFRDLFLPCLLCLSFPGSMRADKPPTNKHAVAPVPKDTLVFENGDTITGTLDREVEGNVYFKSDELGEVEVPWKKIRSLQTHGSFAVLEQRPAVHIHHMAAVQVGHLSVKDEEVTITPAAPGTENPRTDASPGKSVPVKSAQFILDEETFQKQLEAEPNFFAGWNGSLSAGATLVRGTENQYTYTSAVALERVVPTVSWLQPRNRMQLDFSSSYGRITQPAYVDDGTLVPSSYTKSAIFHADAERDEYLTRRIYGLAQTVFDHNFSQGLNLQQIYGGGLGVTAIKRNSQQLDLKGTLQYESQRFITSASGTDENLVGSTLSGTYVLKLPGKVVLNQQMEYIPAFNVGRAYSANETNTLTIPFYKQISFTIGTDDSYLNDPVPALPPTTRNSFQFSTGVTYTLKSKY
jgi:hypothetical protein